MHRAHYIQEQNILFWQNKVIVVGFMWGLGQHTLLGIVVWFYVGLGQHTLLGIVVGLCGPRATHITVLLLVYVGPWATHFTGPDVGLQQCV
jgi:hypothetical protein